MKSLLCMVYFQCSKKVVRTGSLTRTCSFLANACKVCCGAYRHTCLLLVYPHALFDLQLKMSRGTLTMLTQSCGKLILSGLAKEVDVANGT